MSQHKNKVVALAIGALGVVYGDIGTSPLYAINEIFFGHGNVSPVATNVYGCISLVLWALILIIIGKYLFFVLRADNGGEGGVFALYSLLNNHRGKKPVAVLLMFLLLTAGLLYGDGLITPAISVLSAVEGLAVATPRFAPYVILITIAILTALFSIQRKGTAKVGTVFGPIIICWYLAIALLGGRLLMQNPAILNAFNPRYAFAFIKTTSFHQLLIVLGSVMLAITGGEALYADMGHFGKTPIRLGWFFVVFPALLLNYLGQGAYLLSGSAVVGGNIFYSMVPKIFMYPMVILATCATIIASQALISGAFSLTSQAIAIGLFPRLKIKHTHHEHEGQVYIPTINWGLFAGCVALVLMFKSSSALASAYGLAVSGDMLATSCAMFCVALLLWKWHWAKALALFGFFACIDALFLTANSLKFLEGGFIPFSIGVVLFTVMSTWKWGRKLTFAAYKKEKTMTVGELLELKKTAPVINKTVLFMAPQFLEKKTDKIPALIQFFWDRYGALPKNMILLKVSTPKKPYVSENRYDLTSFKSDDGSLVSVNINFGFMEDPNVEALLEDFAKHRKLTLAGDPADWILHVSYERLISVDGISIIRKLRLKLFSYLRDNSQPAYFYYGMGVQVKMALEIMTVPVR